MALWTVGQQDRLGCASKSVVSHCTTTHCHDNSALVAATTLMLTSLGTSEAQAVK